MQAEPTAVRQKRSAARSILRPLASTTYLWRNLGKTGPLIGVIMLAVMLLSGIVTLINSIPHSVKTIYSYSKLQLAVMPRNDFSLKPEVIQDLKTKAPVPIDRLVVCRATSSQVRSIVGKWPFVVLGLKQDDLRYFVDRMAVSSLQGRLPEAGKPEAVISEPVARNLNVKLGGVLLGPDKKDDYSPKHVKIVGIAQSENWFMATSFEYLDKHHFPPFNNMLVYAKNASDQRELDAWAIEKLQDQRAEVFAYQMLEKSTNEMFSVLYKILNVIIGTIVLVLTFLMAMLMNIYQTQRLVEFGLLQAIGYTKRQLLRRVMRESLIVIVLGWILGVGAAYLLLYVVDMTLMYPNAFAMNTRDVAAFMYTLVVPFAILVAATLTVIVRFRKFDPVGVVERRLV